jgi:hypothetical protein
MLKFSDPSSASSSSYVDYAAIARVHGPRTGYTGQKKRYRRKLYLGSFSRYAANTIGLMGRASLNSCSKHSISLVNKLAKGDKNFRALNSSQTSSNYQMIFSRTTTVVYVAHYIGGLVVEDLGSLGLPIQFTFDDLLYARHSMIQKILVLVVQQHLLSPELISLTRHHLLATLQRKQFDFPTAMVALIQKLLRKGRIRIRHGTSGSIVITIHCLIK